MAVKETIYYKQNIEKLLQNENVKCKEIVETAFIEMTKTICHAIGYRDSYTAKHQKKVAELALLVGSRVDGLDEECHTELYIGGMLHDIGKIGVPIDVLNKSTRLKKAEFMLIKDHPQIGYDILRDTSYLRNVKEIVLNHHEKLDGSGYPYGISGSDINMNVRIITVCDVVEAMSTLRPYRVARTRLEVINELSSGRGIKYDKDIVDIMIDLIRNRDYDPWEENMEIIAEDENIWGKYETGYKGGNSRL